MAGSWGVKPLFATLNLNAWAFWIVMFVMIVTFFAFTRIIYIMCLRKFQKRQTISVIDLNEDTSNNDNSAQAIYASVIAPHYFYNNGDNLNESVNAMSEETNKSMKSFENKLMTKQETFDGVDNDSELCESNTIAIRPLTPAYKPLEEVPKEDPLGFLMVPPGYVTNLANNYFVNNTNNNHIRPERTSYSA